MQKNENRLGYKKTKIGWIPEDWECLPLTDVFDRVVVPLAPIETETYQEIGVRSHAKGIFHKTQIKGADLGSKRVFHCQPGALVFNIVFAWEQAVAVLSEQERGLIASHRFPMYKGKEGQALELFYLSFFKTRKGKNGLSIASPGGAGRNKTLGQKEMDYLYVPKPTKSEQEAIAGVLECWDEAIRKYEKRIEKKLNIKKGLIQKLLSGKQRLSGFSGEWKDVQLRQLLSEKPRYGINAPGVPFSEHLPTYLRITDISERGRFLSGGAVSVDSACSADYMLKQGDLVFARTGASTGKTYLYDSRDGKLVYAGFLIKATPNPARLVPEFLKSYTETHAYRKWVSIVSTRSGQPGINGREYASLDLHLPPVDEQDAIASILATADAGIDILERKLVILKDQERFLLNNLVTGTIRLPQFVGATQTADTKGDTE